MRIKLMTHLYYGDPREEFSLKLAKTLLDSGADILEIGIPYTDPSADGEVFQRACQRALIVGMTPLQVLEGIKELRNLGITIPIYLTSYYGPIFKIGVKNFVKRAKAVGVTGLIVPDILLEEQEELKKACEENGLSLIQFATVYSTKERLKEIIKASTDFIYCISLPGVTGDSTPSRSPNEHLEGGRMDSFQVNLFRLVGRLRSMAEKPIYVGFGIKSRQDAKRIIEMGADGIIVGSAITRIYEENLDNPYKNLPNISQFIKSLKESTI